MKKETKGWNPFVGCKFDCVYCYAKPMLHRYNKGCLNCGAYVPHNHPERLEKKRVPSDRVLWPLSTGDMSFCDPVYLDQIINVMRNDKRENRVFLLQSKNPACFTNILGRLPHNVVLMTTLETNRDSQYSEVSKAPLPSQRFHDFLQLAWDRKALAMEPILDFDLNVILEWAEKLKPEAIFIGFETKKKCILPEPLPLKVSNLHNELRGLGLKTYDKAIFKYRDVF
jgi:hypothetical protein